MKHLRQLSGITSGAVMGVLVVLALTAWQPRAWAVAAPISAALPGTSSALSNDDNACDGSRVVHVTGAAAINVTPDRVLIQLGVESNDTTPDRVQAKNTAAIRKVIGAVRGLGVADRDISTDYYIVYPVYDDYNSLKIKGYRIDNVVAITLNDVSKTSDVVIAALKAGANEVLDVQFYTSQLRRYRDEARALAMKAATEKAQALAEAGGTQTGCVLQISENSWSYYNGSWWGGRDRAMWTQNVVQNAPGGGSQPGPDETPISLGQIVVRAEVNASFSLK